MLDQGALMSDRSERFLRACRGESVDTTPVWLMRQAGRYMPEYRALRAQAGDFLSLCRNPELACQVTLQPVEALGVDAPSCFPTFWCRCRPWASS